MGQTTSRPLSPHLGIYRRGIHMMASIIHRVTGFILATAGMMTLVWWLSAIAGGAESYATFQIYAVYAGEEATGFQMASNWFFRLLAATGSSGYWRSEWFIPSSSISSPAFAIW